PDRGCNSSAVWGTPKARAGGAISGHFGRRTVCPSMNYNRDRWKPEEGKRRTPNIERSTRNAQRPTLNAQWKKHRPGPATIGTFNAGRWHRAVRGRKLD